MSKRLAEHFGITEEEVRQLTAQQVREGVCSSEELKDMARRVADLKIKKKRGGHLKAVK